MSVEENLVLEPPVVDSSSVKDEEPTIVFVFELKKWYESINPLTKVELIDIAPIIGFQFFFDPKANGYVLVVTKTKWDSSTHEARRRFMTISRRIKEEIEGAMLTTQRDLYESSDLFDLFAQQKASETTEATDPIVIDTTVNTPV